MTDRAFNGDIHHFIATRHVETQGRRLDHPGPRRLYLTYGNHLPHAVRQRRKGGTPVASELSARPRGCVPRGPECS
jgi:hypothetical protein